MLFWKTYKAPLLLTLVSSCFYVFFAYDLVRTDGPKLILLYTVLWISFLMLFKFGKQHTRLLTIVAFVFRAIFIIAIPNLSQDFYRFIWDGRLLLEGFNPYLYTPEQFMTVGSFPIHQAQVLYEGMGELNGSHFSNYPPLKQLCFGLAAAVSNHSILGSVIVFRLLIIAADFGTLFYGKRLLAQLKLPVNNIFLYILNPFIIIELTGNLHFEGILICCLVWSLYLLNCGKWKMAAIVFAFSISVKLIPLLLLPLFFRYFKKASDHRLNFGRLMAFYAIVGLTTLLLFLPFYSKAFFNNYTGTVALWFQNFEFNASFYYIAREIGYLFRGYNEIAIIGKILALLVFCMVVGIAFSKKQQTLKTLIVQMLFALSVYLFLSTTVHPWYLATLVILSVFTNYKYPMVWSYTIILSYLAYLNLNTADKSENLWIIALEYTIVYTVFIYEVFIKKANSKELASS
ncbi:MAG: mannosyltransferase [Algicola sp.]|nr:mannosyltransferase [Algicola sp.]